MAQVRATATGQAPFAAIVGCIDSRVPPELIFDQQIGDIFAARVAGNFVNTDIIGSLEFATKLAGAKAIVVLGHSDCGAIKGAIDDAKLGNLTATLANIRPSVTKVAALKVRTPPRMQRSCRPSPYRMRKTLPRNCSREALSCRSWSREAN
jgi:carbonic anhydrase